MGGDLDSVGSATGFCCAIRNMVKEAYVVVDPEQNLSKTLINYSIVLAVLLDMVIPFHFG